MNQDIGGLGSTLNETELGQGAFNAVPVKNYRLRVQSARGSNIRQRLGLNSARDHD